VTAIVITAIIAALLFASSIVTALSDVAQAKHKAARSYPRQDGEVTVLGPEIFTDQAGDVICWKGVNYVRQESKESSA
jgi:cytochrome oxidase Cu insertion factor (SCO1/SenC/PrrC family)